jgi:oxygen-independent coproporphyrinogen-3 oxidase
MPQSAYIHIPFCKSKCKYCSFVSGVNIDRIPEYVDALLKDIELNYEGEKLKTLYFGGGTPSLLPVNFVEKILSKFNFETNPEITFEMNPDDADFSYLCELNQLGINRLSIGSQSFDDNVLTLIGRRHNSQGTVLAVQEAKNAGFNNISLDLIYGLPEQNISFDIEKILEQNVQHISTYGLKIESGSYFYKHKPRNLPDDDKQADMYLEINRVLSSKGFKRYEVSNFSYDGYESKHNLTYWDNTEYYGFGLASHGYKNGVRYSKPVNLEKYLKFPNLYETEHRVSQTEKLEEEIFLGFRKTSGIDIEKINKNFLIDFDQKYNTILKKYSPRYIEQTPQGYRLTLEGTLLSNNILSEFID